MRALVTGCAGFVGRHVLDALDRTGWDTAGLDLVDGYDALEYFRSARSARWDLVVHAAASAPHRAAIDSEAEHFARNVHLDSALFDWADRTGQGRVLYLSSSAAYPLYLQDGGVPREPMTERQIDLAAAEEPDSNYGWAKLTGERMAAAARRKGLPVTVVRPFSGYGEDQAEDFPFRAILERVKRHEDPVSIWGDGTQVRDWVHIDDVVAGMLAVVESGTEEPVNLCTGVGTSMVSLAAVACDYAGYSPKLELLPDKPAGVAYRVGNPARLHRFYKPRISLAEGIERALRSD